MTTRDYPAIGERTVAESLPNGLRVIVVPKLGYNRKYAFFATRYGGADRRFKLGGRWIDTPSGVAHFLEHKMFDQPDGTNALSALSALGASPNAFTSSDITAYHFECTDRFDECLRLLLEFVMTPYYTEESVAKEQGIIGQEIRMTEDSPHFRLYYDLLGALYRHNPIRDSVAGTVESIAQIKAQTLYDCHRVFYNPSNMVLVVAGDVDPARVFDTARALVTAPAGEQPERDYGPAEEVLPVSREAARGMEVGLPLFLIGAKTDAGGAGRRQMQKALTASLALEVLLGRSSALYKELYEGGLINANFSADFDAVAGVAHTVVGGESRDPMAVRDRLVHAVEDAARNGCDAAAFGRVKKALTGAKLRELNSFDSICYNTARGFFGQYDYFETLDVLGGIAAADVQDFIRRDLDPARFAVSVVHPGG